MNIFFRQKSVLNIIKRHGWSLSGFLFLTIIATYPIIFKISSAFYGPILGTDNRAVIWHFWWLKYSWKHHLCTKVITIIAYPFGVDISFKPSFPLEDFIFRWATILTSDVATYNCAILLSFILSAVFVYWIAFHFTKNKPAAFLSGVIFAFSPYHFNKVWEHFSLGQIQWVPLYILALLFLRKKPCFKNAFYLALAFTLVASFDFSYSYIILIFTTGFLLYIFLYQWRTRLQLFFHRDFKVKYDGMPIRRIVGWTVAAAFFAIIINLAVLWPIFKRVFIESGQDIAFADLYERPFHYLFSHSARPLTYFFPSVEHPVFGHFTRSMFGSVLYGRDSIEHTLYVGFIPLLLSFVAVNSWKQKRKVIKVSAVLLKDENDFIIGFFLFSALLAYVFSMPPYIDFGLFKLYFPSFFLYNILPMFRSYARFGIITILSISVLAGFGLSCFLKNIKSFQNRAWCFIICLTITLFEFTNIPPSRVTQIKNIPAVYKWLAGQNEDVVVAEYPMTEGGYGEAKTNLNYLFYQRIHQKRLVNGASGISTSAFAVKKKILKVDDISVVCLLKNLGVDYVIIHEDLFKTGESRTACDIIGCVPDLSQLKEYSLIKTFGVDKVYKIERVHYD